MNVAGISKLASSVAETGNRAEVGATVLKKALELESSTAAQLLASVKPPQSSNLPAHLGKNINTTA